MDEEAIPGWMQSLLTFDGMGKHDSQKPLSGSGPNAPPVSELAMIAITTQHQPEIDRSADGRGERQKLRPNTYRLGDEGLRKALVSELFQ
jgi:hypothetical protein